MASLRVRGDPSYVLRSRVRGDQSSAVIEVERVKSQKIRHIIGSAVRILSFNL